MPRNLGFETNFVKDSGLNIILKLITITDLKFINFASNIQDNLFEMFGIPTLDTCKHRFLFYKLTALPNEL